jgi:hypothetical protein
MASLSRFSNHFVGRLRGVKLDGELISLYGLTALGKTRLSLKYHSQCPMKNHRRLFLRPEAPLAPQKPEADRTVRINPMTEYLPTGSGETRNASSG